VLKLIVVTDGDSTADGGLRYVSDVAVDPVMHQSPLHDRHVAMGARFAPFAGWSMPLEFSGVLKEHRAVRESVGVFDVSHLGKVHVEGHGAAAFINECLTNDLGKIGPGQAQYTLCCDDATGGVVDDLIAYLRADDDVFLIPNAANTQEVVRRLADAAPTGISVVNQHHDFAVIAVQGTRSDETLAGMGLPVGHDYMSFVDVEMFDAPITVCRTGYTGERGYELVVPNAAAVQTWDAILAAGDMYDLAPAGLGARDTLRTEMGYPLHGQDISLEITPVQARLGWAVGWGKPTFWGSRRLAAEKADGPARVLRGIVAVGRGIPRPGMPVLEAGGTAMEGDEIGRVTSGTFSPTLRKGIALALVARHVKVGDAVAVDIRGRPEPFDVTKTPFVTPGVRES
jgi:aminomethyltransferase